MRLKPGVKLDHLSPQMVLGASIVEGCYSNHGYECTITSGSDGTHKAGSLHYTGNALDFRTRDMKPEDLTPLAASVKRALGENYDVVLEKDHLHCEYDPK